jgi:hypothetical protein
MCNSNLSNVYRNVALEREKSRATQKTFSGIRPKISQFGEKYKLRFNSHTNPKQKKYKGNHIDKN